MRVGVRSTKRVLIVIIQKGFSQKAHCAGRKKNENKEQISNIYNILTQHGHSVNKAKTMIRKYYNKVKKQYRGDSTRDLAMAL